MKKKRKKKVKKDGKYFILKKEKTNYS